MGNLLVCPTADSVTGGQNLEGKVAIITGASSGIGFETTRTLARRGAFVFLTCRDISAGHKAKRDILEQIGERFDAKIRVCQLDLASLQEVRTFVDEFKKSGRPLHYLILNAAVMGGPYRRTKDGFEMHFGVNYLGHFCLVQEFLPLLQQQKEQTSRIVTVCCSPTHRMKMKIKDLPVGKRRGYNARKAYDQSKFALQLFTEELSMKLRKTSVTAVCAEPGWTNTWIVKNLNPIILIFIAFASICMKTPQQGAATVLFACLDRKVAQKQKPYCSNCRLTKRRSSRNRDMDLRSVLYEKSMEWVNNPTFSNDETEAFDLKSEIWRSIQRRLHSFLKERKTLTGKRVMQSTTKYQKLD